MDDNIVNQVKSFIAEQTGCNKEIITLTTTLGNDLGVDGDDADDFFDAFSRKFRVDLSSLQLDRHFGPEGFWPTTFLDFIWKNISPQESHKQSALIPITVIDLINTAQTGRWCKDKSR